MLCGALNFPLLSVAAIDSKISILLGDSKALTGNLSFDSKLKNQLIGKTK
jgi:hypothetical protein